MVGHLFFFTLGFNNINGFLINEENVISRTNIGLILENCNTFCTAYINRKFIWMGRSPVRADELDREQVVQGSDRE